MSAPLNEVESSFRCEEVEFSSDGNVLRGLLFEPEGVGAPAPAVVLAGGWCYVRELVMPKYASMFASVGMASLVFDYRNFGLSEGEPRQHLDPWGQIRDYQNALSFLEGRSDIDSERLGVWGISYSGGHVIILGAIDPRVKAIVSLVPVVDGYRNLRRVHGTIGFRKLWQRTLEDRRLRYEHPGERLYIPHAVSDPFLELSTWPFPETYYTFQELQQSVAPRYENRSTVESVDLLLNYNVSPFAQRLYGIPTLMIVAEGDDLTLWDLEMNVYGQFPTPNKELVVLPGTTHMSIYSDESQLGAAARSACGWFSEQLLHMGGLR